jgi:hypothetical protein
MKKLLLVLTLVSANDGFSAVVDFNEYASPTDNELLHNFVTYDTWTQIPNEGVTGGSAFFVGPETGYARFTPTTYRNDVGDSFSVSASFRVLDPSPAIIIRIGFQSSPSPDLFGHEQAFFSGEWSAGQYRLRSFPSGGAMSPSFVPLGGHWYNLGLSVSHVGPGNVFSLYGGIADLGSTGMETPNPLGSATLIIPDPQMGATTSVYPFVAVGLLGNDRPPLVWMDDFRVNSFEIVPEPSIFTFGFLSCLLLYGFRRKLWHPVRALER